MEKQSKLVTCKHCGEEIAAGAKVCPKCGGKNKKPIYKRPWFIILIVLIVIGAIGSAGGNDNQSDTSKDTNNAVVNEKDSTQKETEEIRKILLWWIWWLWCNKIKFSKKLWLHYLEP